MASKTDVHDISKQIEKLEIEPQFDVSSDLESALSFDGRKDSLSDSNLIPRGAIRTTKPSKLTEPYQTRQLRSDEPYGNQFPNRQSGGQWNHMSQQAHQTGNDTVIENRNASFSAEFAVPTPMNQDTSYLSTRQVSNQDLPSYNENDLDLVLDTIQRDTTSQAGFTTPVDRTMDPRFNELLHSLMEYDNGSQQSTSASTSQFFQKEPFYQKTENSRVLPSSNATPVHRNKHAGKRSSRNLQSESFQPFSSNLTANVSDSTVENCPPQNADSFGSGWPQTYNAETCQAVSHFNVSSSNNILPIISEISSSIPVTPIHIILQGGNQNIAPSATQLTIQSLSQQTGRTIKPNFSRYIESAD
ncbi:uncharacterized protein LOC128242839 [Mya arenaria]|uniref:uncharacterized protein LOC128209403 n=1 Tax=Mya arenaria TaxID=6604 RepID=UPI0022E46AD6|nr:uncharacterized protein LOC128209403 [Mya arenaria]XP_052808001.1 uncharacterized protein LOC128236905 [Mya arenaria]XP_052816159.1 uncharacterized protein LOC128242839 [Mya arenaria]